MFLFRDICVVRVTHRLPALQTIKGKEAKKRGFFVIYYYKVNVSIGYRINARKNGNKYIGNVDLRCQRIFHWVGLFSAQFYFRLSFVFGPVLFSADPFRPTFYYINYMYVIHEYWIVYYFILFHFF